MSTANQASLHSFLNKAFEYTAVKHTGQYRKSITIPYITHTVEVTKRTSWYTEDQNTLTAAANHDVIEDCLPKDVARKEIKELFGEKVLSIVEECSREDGHNENHQKYEFLRSFRQKSNESILIKIADRFCNINDYITSYYAGKGSRGIEYAAEYALQARDLFEEYGERNFSSLFGFNKVIVESDITFMRQLIMRVLGFEPFSRSATKFLTNNGYFK